LCCTTCGTRSLCVLRNYNGQIPDISQKSLTQTLRTLEEDGFVSREVFPEITPRMEYSLTPRALSFLPLVENIINLAKENMEEIMADRAKNRC
jgi:DNA-binding HxlR family transcriptional regulator